MPSPPPTLPRPETTAQLARLHAWLRDRSLVQRFTLLTRTLLSLGFVAPGLTKVAGHAFAPGIDPSTPMGAYFVAFHETGVYYAFVGLMQIAAGLLLLARRTALLGACLYLPIIANIFVLVTATRFGTGTPVITGLMTLGAVWLIVWDAHRLTPVVAPAAAVPPLPAEPAAWDVVAPASAQPTVRYLSRLAYLLTFGGLLGFTLAARGFVAGGMRVLLLAAVAGVLLAGLGWLVHLLRPRLA